MTAPTLTATIPAIWRRPTRVHFGAGAVMETLEAASQGRTLVVVDADQPHLAELLGYPHHLQQPVLVRLDTRTCDLAGAIRLARVARGAARIIAAGGGTVLDQAALARLFLADTGMPRRIRHGGPRPGLVHGPTGHTPGGCPDLVAIPTTVGTAAEVSAAATVMTGGHRKLVMHPLLAADVAALDPAATRSLPAALRREGTLEALLRTCNAYLAPPGERCPPGADTEARDLLRELSRSGTADAPPHDIAVLSARTLLGLATLGRNPFSGTTWYLANELAAATGIRKMAATTAVLPHIWQRILDGDTRCGDGTRLHDAWNAIRRGSPHLPAHPVAGFRALTASWGLSPTAPVTITAEVLARRAAHAWGAGLPMLGAFTTGDLTRLYARILQGPPS
ncbi:iron-containing alcohol dehydrogenase [Streptomyces chrestomyceticus]|uniref:iron-containing alcohol dehydrogenase n=1 Tax=Streptomyces chrestomyceticus TaxID=68185 RepID=UPI0035A8C892